MFSANGMSYAFLRRFPALLLIILTLSMSSHPVGAFSSSSKNGLSGQASTPDGFVHGLVDQNGNTVLPSRLLGKVSVVHFGFTYCPDVCPTTLIEVAQLMADLGAVADHINFLFVTVDPARDTPSVLKTYLNHFDDRIIGLTGSEKAIAALAKSFNTSFAKREFDGGYSMDHAIFAYLKDSKWRTVATLYMGTGASKHLISQKLRLLLKGAVK